MEYRFLGRSGLQVSELCLGTMMFGEQTDEQMRKQILDAVQASLRRLGTDYIDLYQLHVWDNGTPIEETLSTLDALVKEGTVRYVGASNFCGWQLQKALDVSRQNGWEAFVSLQPLYNLLDREAEWELLSVCRSEGIGVIPWSPLRAGWLSGAYRRGMTGPSEGTRVKKESDAGGIPWSEYATERTWRVIDEVSAITAETGRTAAQVSLRWLLQREPVTAPIIGARTLEHAKDNLAAADWSLTAEQADRLTTASAADTVPYPYGLLDRLARR